MTCNKCKRFNLARVSKQCCGCWKPEKDCECLPARPCCTTPGRDYLGNLWHCTACGTRWVQQWGAWRRTPVPCHLSDA